MNEQGFIDVLTRRAALHRIGLLAGGTLSAPLISGVLAGCRAEPPGAAFVPQTLDADQYALVQTLAEIIIPTTDTPGARDAGVPAFIDKMLTDWYLEEDRLLFLDGLQRLDEQAEDIFIARFIDIGDENQIALIDAVARKAFPEASDTDASGPIKELLFDLSDFFKMLKELTVVGYYTSEVGATVELRVQPMGTYRGDIPYDEVGRAWA